MVFEEKERRQQIDTGNLYQNHQINKSRQRNTTFLFVGDFLQSLV